MRTSITSGTCIETRSWSRSHGDTTPHVVVHAVRCMPSAVLHHSTLPVVHGIRRPAAKSLTSRWQKQSLVCALWGSILSRASTGPVRCRLTQSTSRAVQSPKSPPPLKTIMRGEISRTASSQSSHRRRFRHRTGSHDMPQPLRPPMPRGQARTGIRHTSSAHTGAARVWQGMACRHGHTSTSSGMTYTMCTSVRRHMGT